MFRRGAFDSKAPSPRIVTDPAEQKQILHSYFKTPLCFEKNQGQTDPSVGFLARTKGYCLFLTPSEAVFRFSSTLSGRKFSKETLETSSDVVRMGIEGGNRLCRMEGEGLLNGKSNYFIGSNPAKWVRNVGQFSRVKMGEVYPGIDLIYYGSQGRLEYDFVVKPGADPKAIRLRFQGAEKIEINPKGALALRTRMGRIILDVPSVYQPVGKGKKTITGKFVRLNRNEVGLEVKTWDRSQPLVIDPTLDYSTYLGGNAFYDDSDAIAVDTAGNAYVTGWTYSSAFPTTAGVLQPVNNSLASGNAFVTKLNPTGTALIYSTYLGGSGGSYGKGIALDSSGNAYVTGWTGSGFPTTSGAFQTVFEGGFDVFVAKLNNTGSALVYSTYLGGTNIEYGNGIAVDGGGNAYVTGQTGGNFPTTGGAFQTIYGGGTANAFVAELNASGGALVYSTYLGGSGYDIGSGIAVDSSGSAYVTGQAGSTNFPTTGGAFQTALGGGGGFFGGGDAFVTKLNPGGSSLAYSTYLGGSGGDAGNGIAVDGSGNAYVTGFTNSTNFPTTSGAFQVNWAGSDDAFITKLNPTGSNLVYSTYLGGSSSESGNGIAVDSSGNAYVTGTVSNLLPTGGVTFIILSTPTPGPTPTPLPVTSFPTTSDAYQASFTGTDAVFVTELNATGNTLVYSTFLGGNPQCGGAGIALNGGGNIYVTGETTSFFPTTTGAFQTTFGKSILPVCYYSGFSSFCIYPQDGFVAKFSVPTPTPLVGTPCQSTLYVSKNLYRPSTDGDLTFRASLCYGGDYSVIIYNTAGEVVRILRKNPGQAAGADPFTWDGKNSYGEPVASGVYLIRFTESFGVHVAKVLLVR